MKMSFFQVREKNSDCILLPILGKETQDQGAGKEKLFYAISSDAN